jgi:hypothetical protein
VSALPAEPACRPCQETFTFGSSVRIVNRVMVDLRRHDRRRELFLSLSLPSLTIAQTPRQTSSALPRLVRVGGVVKDLNSHALTGVVGVTFALYSVLKAKFRGEADQEMGNFLEISPCAWQGF